MKGAVPKDRKGDGKKTSALGEEAKAEHRHVVRGRSRRSHRYTEDHDGFDWVAPTPIRRRPSNFLDPDNQEADDEIQNWEASGRRGSTWTDDKIHSSLVMEAERSRSEAARESAGQPLRVARIDGQHRLQIDEDALRSVLLRDDAKDCTTVLVAVAGALRMGKSFLLSYFLRYLSAGGDAGWMGDPDDPLRGFSWRGGADRDTTGILMWSRPFLRRTPAGERVAVLLMDTQGTFDTTSTMKDCSTVFALTTMVTSVMIYNVMHQIQEDDLQHLQFFTEYSRLALRESENKKPFQDLIFLVRDWPFPYEFAFGFGGGDQVLRKIMEVKKDQHPELASVRKGLVQTFENIRCYLMPHPGATVASDGRYDGRASMMNPEFKQHLQEFVESVLAPPKLVPKEIGKSHVKCRDLLGYFQMYAREFCSQDLPEPKTLYMATAEGNHLAALSDARCAYARDMETLVGPQRPYASDDQLRVTHLRARDHALRVFDERPKMGGPDMEADSRGRLQLDLDTMLREYIARNNAKSLVKMFVTPLLFMGAALFFYLIAHILRMFRQWPAAKGTSAISTFCMLVAVVWVVLWCTGAAYELRCTVDVTVGRILEVFLFGETT